MKERPILFSAPMVRAILDGTKTQTRRVLKRQPWASCSIDEGFDGESPFVFSALGGYGPGYEVTETRTPCISPFGQPGDRLWLREAWMPDPPCDGTWNYTEWAGCRIGQIAAVPDQFRKPEFCNYRATWPHKEDGMLWTPGIHMPRWASRIDLLIKSVRVERLQDISEEDAKAEGCEPVCMTPTGEDNGSAIYGLGGYIELWESINGPGSWEANPWVWAIEFERVGK